MDILRSTLLKFEAKEMYKKKILILDFKNVDVYMTLEEEKKEVNVNFSWMMTFNIRTSD